MGERDDSGTEDQPKDPSCHLNPSLNAIIDMYEDDLEDYWKGRVDIPLVEDFLDQMKEFSERLVKGADDLVSPEEFAEPPDAFWKQWEAHYDGFRRIWGEWQSNLEQAIKAHPELTPKEREVIRSALTQADARGVAAEQATEPPPPDLPILRVVWERLAVHFAYEGCAGGFERQATRLLRLARHVVKAKPGKPTIQFLTRVSRCYVWGFDDECVILCRGAIDTAFRESIGDEACAKYEHPAARYGFTLAQRIQTALRDGIITSEAEKAARRVNMLATKSAHDQPGYSQDPLGVIRDTLLVVQQLAGASPGKQNAT